nr:hypothetical protein [Tanacetum cinerariifolium]
MNYPEKQTDREAMINSIKNGDQQLPCVTQVSIAETTSTEQPPLKDKSMWSDQEKRVQKIDHLARSLLIQGLPNDIYSLIDSNKTAKDLWDALARHMIGSEYDAIMSDTEDSMVTYTTALPPPDYMPGPEEPEQAPPSPVYIPYVPEPVYPEYIPPKDDVFPAEEQPLPAAASPTAESPGYIPKSDPDGDPEEDDDEDPEEDPADYLADHDDDEEEEDPSRDDDNEEDEEHDEDDDDDEEEHPASADSIPPPSALRVMARISFRPQPPTMSFTKEDAVTPPN